MEKYNELERTVRWTAYALGVSPNRTEILGGIRALKRKVKELEMRLEEAGVVFIPTELPGIGEEEDEGVEVE